MDKILANEIKNDGYRVSFAKFFTWLCLAKNKYSWIVMLNKFLYMCLHVSSHYCTLRFFYRCRGDISLDF